MSQEIATSLVQQYRSSMTLLAQQQKSRLRDAVMVEPATGQTLWYDQVGASVARQITNRHADTFVADTPHRRRRINLTPYAWSDLIDTVDKLRMLADPTSSYVEAGNAAMNRAIDDTIIASFFATANTGVDGSITVTWPPAAAQVVAVNSWVYGSGSGNAGLTISKLIEASTYLRAQEGVDDAGDNDVCIGVTAKQIANLLSTTEATSADYNTVRALMSGTIDSFMGFKFIRTERLQTDGSGYYRVPVWHKKGVCLAIAEDLTRASIDVRPDKNLATQVYYEMVLGAARIEDTRVVEIKCL